MCDFTSSITCDHDLDLILSIINIRVVDAPIDLHRYTNDLSEPIDFRTHSSFCTVQNIPEATYNDTLCEATLDHNILFPRYRVLVSR